MKIASWEGGKEGKKGRKKEEFVRSGVCLFVGSPALPGLILQTSVELKKREMGGVR